MLDVAFRDVAQLESKAKIIKYCFHRRDVIRLKETFALRAKRTECIEAMLRDTQADGKRACFGSTMSQVA